MLEPSAHLLVALAVLLVTPVARAAPSGGEPHIDPALAGRYFEEARALAARDHQRLWDVSLAGPMLFVDPETRDAVANQADGAGALTARDGVFVGRFPPELGAANTATRWSGVRWTMLMWPLPTDGHARAKLLMHEAFHRVQEELHLQASQASNTSLCEHLDTLEGRVWLQLEWRALEEALLVSGEARKAAVTDALVFRGYRRSLFEDAGPRETALELSEGLAEYTGVKLAARGPAQATADAVIALDGGL